VRLRSVVPCLALLCAANPVPSGAAAPSAAPAGEVQQPVGRYVNRSTTAMGTFVQIRVWLAGNPTAADEARAGAAIEKGLAELRRLEALMTTWKPESDVSRINAAAGKAPVKISDEVFDCIARSLGFAKRSFGAFDISFYALKGLWHFDDDLNPTLPDDAEVRRRLPLIDWQKIELDRRAKTVRLAREGMAINLGGIGKGYAVDAAVRVVKAAGFANGLVQAGGDLMIFGSKSGQPFMAGVRDPRSPDPDDYFAVCPVADHAFSTAGDYERAFLKGGKRYHHILDPKTGYPATGARSVTVYARDATTADGLDDAVLILGPERGLRVIEETPDAGAIIVDTQNRVHISKRLQGRVRIIHPPTDAP